MQWKSWLLSDGRKKARSMAGFGLGSQSGFSGIPDQQNLGMNGHIIDPSCLVFIERVVGDKPVILFVQTHNPFDIKLVVPGQNVDPLADKIPYTLINDDQILVIDGAFHALAPPVDHSERCLGRLGDAFLAQDFLTHH